MRDFLVGILAGIGVTILVWGETQQATNDSWRYQIVEHGCAEYYLDKNHERQWRWKHLGEP